MRTPVNEPGTHRREVGRREARTLQAIQRRARQLLVGVAPAQVIACGKHFYLRFIAIRPGEACHRTREHVGGGIEGEDELGLLRHGAPWIRAVLRRSL